LAPDYFILATVTRDLGADGGFTIGGTGAFSACMARALGQRVALASRYANDVDCAALGGVETAREDAARTTTFENRYEAHGRVQVLLERAGELTLAATPADWLRAPIVHIGPLAQDIDPHVVEHFPNALLGVTPQGWLRRWDAAGHVTPCPWTEPEPVLARADAIVLSIEDVGGDWAQIEAWAEHARVMVVTEAEHGATVFHAGERRRFAAPRVELREPTGAGDLFAAAYFIDYAACRDAWAAAERSVWMTSHVLAARDGRFPSTALVQRVRASAPLR
jgi:sugar/nucleoside kinase (ribokinase family)